MPPLIRSAKDLITPHQAVRDGFLSQALTKTRNADPYVAQARRFWQFLEKTQDLDAAVRLQQIRLDLLAAAGFSDKAQAHLTEAELTSALADVIGQITANCPDWWRQELLYRFLLTKGDALGGSMRNYAGASAAGQFARIFLDVLERKGITPRIRYAGDKKANKIQGVFWGKRILLFDKMSPFIGKNVDAILLDETGSFSSTDCLRRRETYLACGELKGGIDPAGADEHWKTAGSAIERIRQAFPDRKPHLFFVGAAIEQVMAEEIFEQLADGRMAHAANLAVPEQVTDLAVWLSEL